MKPWVKVTISAITQFIIAGCGAAVAVLTDAGTISVAAMAVAIMTGLVSAAKDVQAALMRSPRDEP